MYSIQQLQQRFIKIRKTSETICAPLLNEDYQIQAIVETSPPKWHLAHVTWFFEAFLLTPHYKNYIVHHPQYNLLFNSYYETVGTMHPRPNRGLLSRPTVKEIYAYRKAIDLTMQELFVQLEQNPDEKLLSIIELGINHEQQHQELLCMDIKYNFSINPLKPAYRTDLPIHTKQNTNKLQWHEQQSGVYEIGQSDKSFSYDNESPRHRQYLADFKLADRLVTNAEYLEFMDDDGYQRSDLWLADAWYFLKKNPWRTPLYWQKEGDKWMEMSLAGLKELNPHEPVSHISYYEADAFARWSNKRLPTEAEVEVVISDKPIEGNFFDSNILHPQAATESGQWYGDLWGWTSTAYHPYPGFKPFEGSAGEYNGKFMSNQMVLRGGSCATSVDHMRSSYRNFFYPHDRWQFSGIRLADNP